MLEVADDAPHGFDDNVLDGVLELDARLQSMPAPAL
jgi:hypothetical protein